MKRFTLITGSIAGVLLICIVIAAAIWIFWAPPRFSAEPERTSYTREDIIALTKPAVVQVLHTGTAEVVVPPFDIDPETLRIEPQGNVSSSPYREEYPFRTSGTGFVIRPDGYILTNAHLVSEQRLKNQVIQPLLNQRSFSIPNYREKFLDMDQEVREHNAEIIKELVEITFHERRIMVASPVEQYSSMASFLLSGLEAELVHEDPGFLAEGRDVAVLRVDEDRLPTVSTQFSYTPSIGETVHSIGYPASAATTFSGIGEAGTYTSGTINARKQLSQTTFDSLQIDIKSSQGASGSPLFNDRARAYGIVSVVTDPETGNIIGDSFFFGVPGPVIASSLENADITPRVATSTRLMREGIALAKQQHCVQAIQTFERAADRTNSSFSIERYTSDYIEDCRSVIDRGDSIDTYGGALFNTLTRSGTVIWLVIAIGAVIVLVLAGALAFSFHRIHEDEDKIRAMRERFRRWRGKANDAGQNAVPSKKKDDGQHNTPEE